MATEAEFAGAVAELELAELRRDLAGAKRKVEALEAAVAVHPETKRARRGGSWRLLAALMPEEDAALHAVTLERLARERALEVEACSKYEDQKGNCIWYETMLKLVWYQGVELQEMVVRIYGDSECDEATLTLRGCDEELGVFQRFMDDRVEAWLRDHATMLDADGQALAYAAANVHTCVTPHALEKLREQFWFCLAPAFSVERDLAEQQPPEPEPADSYDVDVADEAVVVDVE